MDPERALYATKGMYGGQVITCDRVAADQMIAGGYAIPLEDAGLGRTPMGGATADTYDGVTFTTLNGRAPPEPPPPEEPEMMQATAPAPSEEESPWESFTKHAQFDDYLAANDIAPPEGWAGMTIAAKKTWLNDNAEIAP